MAMGFIGGIFDGGAEVFSGIQNIAGGRKRTRDANEAQQYYEEDLDRYLKGYDKLNRKPTYQSQLVGPYQRTQSPVARAYLESMLTGDNTQAAATPWGNPNDAAGVERGRAKRYGDMDTLLDASRDDQAKTPWATKTPEEPEDRNPATRTKKSWEY